MGCVGILDPFQMRNSAAGEGPAAVNFLKAVPIYLR
jgi:hypothetical protein